MRKNIKDFLASGRVGLAMGGKFLWGIIGTFGILGWVYGTLAAGNPHWNIPIWLFFIIMAFVLSIGITPYLGQKEKTKRTENWGKGLKEDMQQARDRIEQLEKRIRELSCPPSSTIRKEPL